RADPLAEAAATGAGAAGDKGAGDKGAARPAAAVTNGSARPGHSGEPPDLAAAQARDADGVSSVLGGQEPARQRTDTASAARVFDAATTRRRSVIFEEDDDLDLPHFLTSGALLCAPRRPPP